MNPDQLYAAHQVYKVIAALYCATFVLAVLTFAVAVWDPRDQP